MNLELCQITNGLQLLLCARKLEYIGKAKEDFRGPSPQTSINKAQDELGVERQRPHSEEEPVTGVPF